MEYAYKKLYIPINHHPEKSNYSVQSLLVAECKKIFANPDCVDLYMNSLEHQSELQVSLPVWFPGVDRHNHFALWDCFILTMT